MWYIKNKKSYQKNGFTMIELIFVIVILGILAGVALPRLVATRDDAVITKGRSDVATIRSAIISERSQRILSGGGVLFVDPANLAKDTNDALFTGILPTPIYQKRENGGKASGRWRQGGANNIFIFRAGSSASDDVTFTYTRATGTFDCDHSKENCKQLTE